MKLRKELYCTKTSKAQQSEGVEAQTPLLLLLSKGGAAGGQKLMRGIRSEAGWQRRENLGS
jgi:hypothetical protein